MVLGTAAQSAGAKMVFALRHKSKCSRHDWKGQKKNVLKILNSTDFRVFFPASYVFLEIYFSGHCGIVFGFRRETSLRRTFLVACA